MAESSQYRSDDRGRGKPGLAWAALVGAAILALSPGRRIWTALLGPIVTGWSMHRRQHRKTSWRMLHNAIVGCSKQAIASVFGPPRSAALRADHTISEVDRGVWWQSDVWYYPLEEREKSIMAIHFDAGTAREVEKIALPARDRE